MKHCPYLSEQFIEEAICVYLRSDDNCEDIKICPGNGDAWCHDEEWKEE